ncbi:hypothetical protein P7C70_g6101, partial [Phenoliferia sp. Uapishka_3]
MPPVRTQRTKPPSKALQKSPRKQPKSRDVKEAALLAVENGTKSCRGASRLYGVPEASLRRWVKVGYVQDKSERSNALLTPAEEQQLAVYLERLASAAHPMGHCQLRHAVKKMLDRKAVASGQKEAPQVGRNWVYRFLHGHRDNLHVKRSQLLEAKRASMANPKQVQKWFELFRETCDKFGIDPDNEAHAKRILNCDETGRRSGMHGGKKIVGSRKSRPYVEGSGGRENVSILSAVGADGKYYQPLIIFKGQRVQSKWFNSCAPDEYRPSFAVSEKGWIDADLKCRWMEAHFIDEARKNIPDVEWMIMIVDGHNSNLTLEFLESCVEKKVAILCLPAHSTHILQPLDLACFGPNRTYWEQAVEDHYGATRRSGNVPAAPGKGSGLGQRRVNKRASRLIWSYLVLSGERRLLLRGGKRYEGVSTYYPAFYYYSDGISNSPIPVYILLLMKSAQNAHSTETVTPAITHPNSLNLPVVSIATLQCPVVNCNARLFINEARHHLALHNVVTTSPDLKARTGLKAFPGNNSIIFLGQNSETLPGTVARARSPNLGADGSDRPGHGKSRLRRLHWRLPQTSPSASTPLPFLLLHHRHPYTLQQPRNMSDNSTSESLASRHKGKRRAAPDSEDERGDDPNASDDPMMIPHLPESEERFRSAKTSRRSRPRVRMTNWTWAEEMRRATQRTDAPDVYRCYALPVFEVPRRLDRHDSPYVTFKCIIDGCNKAVPRALWDSGTGNLRHHFKTKHEKAKTDSSQPQLVSYKVTGTQDLDPKEIPQLFALWVACNNRTFTGTGDKRLIPLLHPTAQKHRPERHAISKAVQDLYDFVRLEAREKIKTFEGATWLGTDGWQTPNGLDVMGVSLYFREKVEGRLALGSMPLDFVPLIGSHTGQYLAYVLYEVIQFYELESSLNGVVTDNASNMEAMIKALGKKPLLIVFKGEKMWIRCFAHILNLICCAIWIYFEEKKKKKGDKKVTDDEPDEPEEEEPDIEDLIAMLDVAEDEDEEGDLTPDELAALEKDLDEVDDDTNLEPREEQDDDAYTRASCRRTLLKFAIAAKKMRYNKASRLAFAELCAELDLPTPHRLPVHVKTRWNSRYLQLVVAAGCGDALLKWQKLPKMKVKEKNLITQADLNLSADLVRLFEPLYKLTLEVSKKAMPVIADVLLWIDAIQGHFDDILGDDESVPALHNAVLRGNKLLNKYYSLSDQCIWYRIAILLHPSLGVAYLVKAGWEPSWIEEAIRVAEAHFKKHYAHLSTTNGTGAGKAAASSSRATGSAIASMLTAAAAAPKAAPPKKPVDRFAREDPRYVDTGAKDDDDQPIMALHDPFVFWENERREGREHGGLTAYALDVFSAPGLSRPSSVLKFTLLTLPPPHSLFCRGREIIQPRPRPGCAEAPQSLREEHMLKLGSSSLCE